MGEGREGTWLEASKVIGANVKLVPYLKRQLVKQRCAMITFATLRLTIWQIRRNKEESKGVQKSRS